MTYALPNATSYFEFFVWANNIVDGWLALSLLISILIISFYGMKQFGTAKALTASLFFTLIIAILMRFADLINDSILIGAIVLFILSFLMLFLKED